MADPARTPTPRSARRRRRRMAPQQRRDHLITTTLQLYGERSPEDTSVDDIVAAADVSRALFYRYFANAQELHVTALSRIVDDLLGQLTVPSSSDFRTDLRAALERFLSFAVSYAASYSALLRTGSTIATGDPAALIDRVRNHVVEQFRDYLDLAELPGPLERTLRAWIAAVETTALSWLQHRDISDEQLAMWLTDQLIAMLATTAGHHPTTADSLQAVLTTRST